ncbi:MAG: DegV family protein [Acidobacteriota bacterium]|nr:DegV family protein [Acidobacteriota bacterium]
MAVRIITDSASDIIDIDRDDLVVVPLTIAFGGDIYHDGADLTHERFYELLVESGELPTTGQVTPYDWGKVFDEAVESGDDVVCITISSGLSGTNQAACLAAQDHPDRVFVVDSLNACLGERILVEHALNMADQGASAQEIAEDCDRRKGDIRLIALLDTLEYLRKGGRIDAVSAGVGAMLQIKPVITIKDGKVATLGKARGSKNGRNLLNEVVGQSGGVDFSLPIAIGYSGLSDRLLQKYVEDSRQLWESELDQLPTHTVGSTIGTHVGPGAIALAYFHKG